jgi:hypothetical protein
MGATAKLARFISSEPVWRAVEGKLRGSFGFFIFSILDVSDGWQCGCEERADVRLEHLE